MDHGSWIAIIIGHIYACCSEDDDEYDYDDSTVPMITATATNAVAAPMSARVCVPQFGINWWINWASGDGDEMKILPSDMGAW